MSIVLQGSTSGSVTLQEPAIAGSTVLTLPAVSGTVLTTGSSGQSIPKAALPTGSVLQVVQGIKTDTFVTSASVTDTAVTGLTVAITPTSSTSKILVFCNLSMASENGQGGAPKLTRTIGASTTQLSLADSAGSRSRGSFAGGGYRGSASGYTLMNWNQNLTYLDSPATTSAITYGVQVSSITVGTYINRSGDDLDNNDRLRSVSYITVMEIAS